MSDDQEFCEETQSRQDDDLYQGLTTHTDAVHVESRPGEPFQPPYQPHGPGILESLGWIFLFFGLQILWMLIVFIPAIIISAGSILELKNFPLDRWLQEMNPTLKLTLFTSPAFLGYLLLIPLGLFRLAPHALSRINLSRPGFGQMLVAASMVLPLTMVADASMNGLEPAWELLMERYPALARINNSDVHKMLTGFAGASLPVALFLIAVVPGIGEEFLFRGLLGRGLVARWGLFVGVGMTSVLFAAVHIYPPHVIAIIPVGIALHWIYLTTKSFWAPVMFHFLNNGIATILMRAKQVEGEQTHPLLIAFSVAYFGWCLYWLYQMRTIQQTEEGPFVSPGFEVSPPEHIHSWRVYPCYRFPQIVALVMVALEILLIVSAFIPGLLPP